MYFCCVTLRKDIDNRQFHIVSSAPVYRAQIWLGKYLGMLALGSAVLLAASIALAISTFLYCSYSGTAAEKLALKKDFFRSYFECVPLIRPLNEEVDARYKRMQVEGTLSPGKSEYEIKNDIREEVRKDAQLVDPSGKRQWKFNFNPERASANADFVILKYKFYAEKKREKINGEFSIDSPVKSGLWTRSISSYPYIQNSIQIPIKELPDSHELRLTFKGENTPYLIFPPLNGVILLYDDGGILANYLRLFLFLFLNMAVLCALSLTFASMFTFTVSVFVTLAVYVVGISSDFFKSVLLEISYGGHDGEAPPMYFLSGFIKIGLWLTKGIQPPPVIERFTDTVAIPVAELFQTWVPGMLIYTVTVIVVGVYVLSKKEIDRIISGR